MQNLFPTFSLLPTEGVVSSSGAATWETLGGATINTECQAWRQWVPLLQSLV